MAQEHVIAIKEDYFRTTKYDRRSGMSKRNEDQHLQIDINNSVEKIWAFCDIWRKLAIGKCGSFRDDALKWDMRRI